MVATTAFAEDYKLGSLRGIGGESSAHESDHMNMRTH